VARGVRSGVQYAFMEADERQSGLDVDGINADRRQVKSRPSYSYPAGLDPLSQPADRTPTLGVSRLSSGPTGGCFVATAVYQDAHAAPVLALRRYRDEVLRQSAPGRAAIRLYAKAGPPAARWVEMHPRARGPLRRALDMAARLVCAKQGR
jgi:hypothetical protein